MQFPTEQRRYPWPANAAHSVRVMLCLEYLPTRASRKWRVSHRMHEAGRATMQNDAPKMAAAEGWHAWRIVEETL